MELDTAGRDEWRRIVPELLKLGLLTSVDRALLIAWCEAWSERCESTKQLKAAAAEPDAETRFKTMQHWRLVRHRAAARLVQISARFGLSPVDRLDLDLGRTAEGDGSDWEGLLA